MAAAIWTSSINATHPGNADACANRKIRRPALHNVADDLMPRNERRAQGRQFAFDDVEVGPADTTSANVEQNLPVPGLRL
jgi:hypothetical protein